jgi:hypothetical protein
LSLARKASGVGDAPNMGVGGFLGLARGAICPGRKV